MKTRRLIAFALNELICRVFGIQDDTDWSILEAKSVRIMYPDLDEYLSISDDARYVLKCSILEVGNFDPGLARRVVSTILNRIASDLRVIESTALNSYQLQAMSIAGNLLEQAHVSAYIGRSEERAREWLEHADFERSYPGNVKAAIRGSLEEQGRPAGDLEMEYRAYGALCMAKHGNPQALKGYGVDAADDSFTIHYGPFVNKSTTVQAKFALYQGIRAAAMASYSAVAPRFGSESELAGQAVNVLGRLNALQQRDLPFITRPN